MNYQIALHTDVGTKKNTNQDSLCVKQAETDKGTVILAVVCDGMGGLEKGEVASATVINAFSNWFENELPVILSKSSYYEDTKYRWDRIIKEQNQNIGEYGRKNHIQLGTTISVMLVFEDGRYLIGHVGDSRIYKITDNNIEVLTLDQTLVAHKVRNGTMTPEEAERDPRRNMLLQCVGASKTVEPDYVEGTVLQNECYMLCSDGFRHVVTADEIKATFAPSANMKEDTMKSNVVRLVELNKERNETDNISAILIKTV
ncbi:MAG: protein phosphatase 2C domain-containing protein [Ruminococcus sp.]|nr:protein phosphatase 2C domain-containing protein [Ruminococcus sp.]